ncbi:MAG: CsgG/HfaB family protein [Thermodesulfovibrionaceae bacterium]
MRKLKLAKIIILLISFLFTPYVWAQDEYAKDIKERVLRVPQCSQPIGVITAKSFKCKAATCHGDRVYFGPGFGIEVSTKALGDGLSDMLITALANTNCFKVVERIALEEIKEELELMGVRPQATLKTADFIITGAVTALELKAGGLGGGGLIIPLPWGLGAKIGKSHAHIGLDMRVVSVKTGEVLAAKIVEGKSERWAFGLAAGGLFGTTIGGAYFEAIKNTPLEEATRDLIVKAVTLIVETVRPLAPADVLVGEKITYYNEKGEIVKEESRGVEKKLFQKIEVTPQKTETIFSAPVKGELIREKVSFEPYPKLLWKEDFSQCKIIPTTVRILRGQGECVSLEGKRWFASTKGQVIFEKAIEKFSPSDDWALEATVFFSSKGSLDHKIFISVGKLDSPIALYLYNDVDWWKWGAGISIPNEAGLPKTVGGQKIKLALKREGDMAHIFVNEVRAGSFPVDSVALKALSPKIVILLEGSDIGAGMYVLVTDLKLTKK